MKGGTSPNDLQNKVGEKNYEDMFWNKLHKFVYIKQTLWVLKDYLANGNAIYFEANRIK